MTLQLPTYSVDELIEKYNQYHRGEKPVDINWVIWELCWRDDPRVADIIVENLSSENALLRHNAAMGITVRKKLLSKTDWRSECARYLPILTKLVQDGKEVLPDERSICGACLALLKIGGLSVVDILINAMAGERQLVRAGARISLVGLLWEDPATLVYLVRELKNPSLFIRAGAAHVLLLIFQEKIIFFVIDQLIEGLQLAELRVEFVGWLGKSDDVKAIDPLISLLGDNISSKIRFWSGEPICIKHYAAEALRTIGNPAVPMLEAALNHEDAEIRAMAVYTLFQIGTESAQAILNSLSHHPDPILRNALNQTINGEIPDDWFKNMAIIE